MRALFGKTVMVATIHVPSREMEYHDGIRFLMQDRVFKPPHARHPISDEERWGDPDDE